VIKGLLSSSKPEH